MVVNTDEEKGNLTEHYDADASRIEVIPPGSTCTYGPGSPRDDAAVVNWASCRCEGRSLVGRLQRLK